MANWDQISESGSVDDRRGTSSGIALAGGGGIIALLLTLGLNYLGLNVPQSTVEDMLNTVSSLNQGASKTTQSEEFKGNDNYEVFVSKVVGSADTVWTDIFARNNLTYEKAKLVLFRDATRTGCGLASTAVGPFYCPIDQSIYLDETFFDELQTRYGSDKGDVAQAYVIAHEIGHHVQNQLGAFDHGTAQSSDESVAIELQADCYAGIWAYAEAKNNLFENGEINEAISAASAVGDDRIQQAQGMTANPETWTHGSSAERVAAFNKGYTTGRPSQCKDLRQM